MKKIEEEKLLNIKGGDSLSASVINSITNLIKVLYDSGVALGSGIRRFSDDNLCPLE